MEININFLTQNDKKQLLEEAMSGIAAATIAKMELGDDSPLENADRNYISSLSPYLGETIDKYYSYTDVINQLTILSVELSKSLEIYNYSLAKTADDISRRYGI